MVNGFWYYRALESVSIASALSSALAIYPCHIRVHQRWQSKLQLPTARKKEWWPATAGSSPHAVTYQHCDTHYFSRPRNSQPSDCRSDALPVVPPTQRVTSPPHIVGVSFKCGWCLSVCLSGSHQHWCFTCIHQRALFLHYINYIEIF